MRNDSKAAVGGVIALAFAAGCTPGARLILRALRRPADVAGLGDGTPGASNVYRAVGPVAGVAVALLDGTKAFVPAAVLRATGAAESVVAAAAAAPVLAHVTVVGGQGAAAALGAAFALDTPATLVALVPIVGGSVLGRHPQGVIAGAVLYPVAHGLMRRRPAAAVQAAALPAILLAARVRGHPGAGPPRSFRVLRHRLLKDRDW